MTNETKQGGAFYGVGCMIGRKTLWLYKLVTKFIFTPNRDTEDITSKENIRYLQGKYQGV
jgi:hypothetical protein